MILFLLLVVVLVFFSIIYLVLYGYLIFGIFCGWFLVFFVKWNFFFEKCCGKMYFCIYLWIEFILLMLFILRFVYWVIEIY